MVDNADLSDLRRGGRGGQQRRGEQMGRERHVEVYAQGPCLRARQSRGDSDRVLLLGKRNGGQPDTTMRSWENSRG